MPARVGIASFASLLLACSGCGPRPPANPADIIYFGGAILTMAGDEPRYVEALAVDDGRIAFVGSRAEASRLAGPQTRQVDLAGKAMLPGFIDGHGHIADYTKSWGKPDLSPPPVGDTRSIADIQAKLAKYLAETRAPVDTLVVINGYDDSLLAEQRHPNRHDLDAVSGKVPVLIVHASGHLAVANSAALAMARIDRRTRDLPGGVIRREPGSREPDGVLEEQALMPFLALFPRIAPEQQVETLGEVQRWYASHGITTAQDGLSTPDTVAMLRSAANQGKLVIDVVSFPMWKLLGRAEDLGGRLAQVEIYRPGSQLSNAGRAYESDVPAPTSTDAAAAARDKLKVGVYENHLKIGGVKIAVDGSPQGKTAFLTQPYATPPPGMKADYRAYTSVPQPELDAWLEASYRYDLPVIVHTNGDAAIDQLIDAVRKARAKYGPKDLRPVAIHAQLARHDQLDAMKELGIVPSFFTAHTFFWGDWHVQSFGEARAFGISPVHQASTIGLKFSNHNDSPIVPPDMMFLAYTAVNRTSRSGKIIGPDERVSPYVAFKAMTDWAAWQYFEEASKGTLEKGKLADFVILERDPLRVEATAIKDVKIVETIKEGRSIWRREGG